MDYITPEQAIEAAKGMTFEKFWALMMEDRKKTEEDVAESRRRIDEIFRKSEESRLKYERQAEESRLKSEESKRQVEESFKRMEKTVADLSANIGGINNTFGQMVEYMVSPHLGEKFAALGYILYGQSENRNFRKDGKVVAEADVFIECKDYVITVESKTKLTADEIDKHLLRMEKVRQCLDGYGDKRKLIGAVAAVVATDRSRDYAHAKGLYVICQNGESFSLVDPPENFEARVWA